MSVLIACTKCSSDQITLQDYDYVLMGEEGAEMVMEEKWVCKLCNNIMRLRDGELL